MTGFSPFDRKIEPTLGERRGNNPGTQAGVAPPDARRGRTELRRAASMKLLTPSTLRHCRHYARPRSARGGTDARARDSAFSPTLVKKAAAKPAAESRMPRHSEGAADSAAPPDDQVTALGSLVIVVGVMGAGTMAYRLYNFGQISTPPEPKQAPAGEEAGAEPLAALTITVRPHPAAASPLPSWGVLAVTHAARGHSPACTSASSVHCTCRRWRLPRAARRRYPRRSAPCCPNGCFGSRTTRLGGRWAVHRRAECMPCRGTTNARPFL